ncbi:hypothetical protein [Microbacterium sp. Marseille-Q6965]|uniref:hypothetical protein n=1 Tax=Microbacterium sp. Marseille-Q6965 TaxID=2965072 RepID=UPI0021B7A475|nr:hypothetical protein [Microbacterium sp. Marseille-Q6965]
MSQSYGQTPAAGPGAESEQGSKTDAVKHEATELKDTAQAEAGHVMETAKQEVSAVGHEAKTQVRDVYRQTTQELRDQAATQQQRVADGLRSLGEQFGSMAQGADNQGMAVDLVQQASQRLSDVSDWLGQRDPGSLLNEVKSFARRKPGMFIAAAAVAGVAAGRLTRALAEGAREEQSTGSHTGTGAAASPETVVAPPPPVVPASDVAATPVVEPGTPGQTAAGGLTEPTPAYDRTRAGWDGTRPSEGV